MPRRRALLLGSVSLLGCHARHDSVLVKHFPHEVTLYVVVSDQAATNDSGNIAAMVDALEAELRSEGRLVTISAARSDESPPVPRLELQVWDSDSGNAQLRGAGSLMMSPVGTALIVAGGGSMMVDVYAVPAPNKARYLGRFSGGSFGATSEAEVAAGAWTGRDIARMLRRSQSSE